MKEQVKRIGMLHIPVNTILAAPVDWQKALRIPKPRHEKNSHEKVEDWTTFCMLERSLDENRMPCSCGCTEEYLDAVRKLSFYPFLEERMLCEADIYARHGFELMLENVGAPYFVRKGQPALIYWVMRSLVQRLRREYPNHYLGIQVLAFSDDWAMDIACKCGLNFVRTESALYEGLRPEGRTPNQGNLARLYLQRQQSLMESPLSPSQPVPRVYVDLHKKHTVFSPELNALDHWLENLVFEKLEGVIITGSATGVAVQEENLRMTRDAIDKAKSASYFPKGMAIPLWVGSGVSVDNYAMCAQYADGLIIGSSLKENGYWECPLDEERVKKFMDKISNE